MPTFRTRNAYLRRFGSRRPSEEQPSPTGIHRADAGHCVELPGVGATGFHYYNPTLLFDGVLDPTKPELLVYEPSGRGQRLAAVEYMTPLSTWSGVEAPDLFGKPFDGPMPEHEPNTSGVHYDQHFWIWTHNPAGVLATWNPSISC